MKKVFLALMLFPLVVYAQAPASNRLRLAYIGLWATTDDIPTGFILRAKAAGYTHILAEYSIQAHTSEWANGYYVGNGSGSYPMKSGLTTAFAKVASYGLKLIPLFQLGSNSARAWKFTNNPNMQCDYTDMASSFCVPVFAPEPNGIDLSFSQLITVIRDAVANVTPAYTLDYIHLGHDEAYCTNINDANCPAVYRLLVGNSYLDQSWLSAHPATSTNTSIELLLANEISRRVSTVQSIIPGTKVIIYGDMWDPQSTGGYFHTANVIKAPDAQVAATINNLILVPWQYDQSNYFPNYPDYNTEAAFDNFANNGYTFLFGNALTDGNNAVTSSRQNQIAEYMNTASSPKYRQKIAGYVSFGWGCTWNNSNSIYNQMPCFKTLEYVSHLYYFQTHVTQ